MRNSKSQRASRARSPAKSLRFEHFLPQTLLDIAYSLHVIQDDTSGGVEIDRVARRIVKAFERSMKAVEREVDSPDHKFMLAISAIVVSYANSIGRCKTDYLEAVENARLRKEEKIRDMSGAKVKSGFAKVAALMLRRPPLIAALAFTVVQTFAPGIEMVNESTDTNFAAFAAGIGFLVLTTIVQSILMSHKMTKIFLVYERSASFADQKLRREQLKEYLRAKRSASEAWELYTGKTSPEWPGYEMVLLENLSLLEQHGNNLSGWKEAIGRMWKRVGSLHLPGRGEKKGGENGND